MPVLLAHAIEDFTDIFGISGGVWTPQTTPLGKPLGIEEGENGSWFQMERETFSTEKLPGGFWSSHILLATEYRGPGSEATNIHLPLVWILKTRGSVLPLPHIPSRSGELGRFQWPRGLRRRSTAARLLRSWVRIPPRAWMFVCCECCMLSDRGLCDGLIIRSEESYRLWCVVECDHETSQARKLKPARGL